MRFAFLLVAFVLAASNARAEGPAPVDLTILDLDWESIEPPSSVGFGLAVDNVKGRSSTVDLTIALPSAWSVFAGLGQSVYEPADAVGVERKLTQAAFGFTTDPLANFVFTTTLDQQKSADNFSDGGVAVDMTYQPSKRLHAFAFVLGLGARNFGFNPLPASGAPKERYEISSRSLTVGVDWFVNKRLDLHLVGTRFSYPDDLSALRETFVPLYVPSETLNYAFGLPSRSASFGMGFNLPVGDWRKPRVGVEISSSQSVVDDLTTVTSEISTSARLTKSLEGRLAGSASRAKDQGGTQAVRALALSVHYFW